MCHHDEKPRREWTLDDYKTAFGSVIDEDGYEWIRLMPRAHIQASDPDLAMMEDARILNRLPVKGFVE